MLAPSTVLTFPPLCICGHQFINKRHVFKSLPLSFTDDLWVAAFVGPEQVQIQHHLSTLSVSGKLNESLTVTPLSGLPDPVTEPTKPWSQLLFYVQFVIIKYLHNIYITFHQDD